MFRALQDRGTGRGTGRGAVAAEGLCTLEVEQNAPFEVQAAATSPNSVIPDAVTSAICRLMSVPCVSSAAAAPSDRFIAYLLAGVSRNNRDSGRRRRSSRAAPLVR